jgi:hypothetical protein
MMLRLTGTTLEKSFSKIGKPGTRILTDVTQNQELRIIDVEVVMTKMIGIMGGRVVDLVKMSQSAGHGGMVIKIAGMAEKGTEINRIQDMIEDQGIRRPDLRNAMAKEEVGTSKAGSAKTVPKMLQKPRKINPQCATESGAEIVKVPIAIGIDPLGLNRIPNG